MSTKLNPYLGFRDNAKQAMEFYKSVFGGELTLSTFAEFQASEDPAEQGKIMHGMLVTKSGLTLMGADTPNSRKFTPGDNYSVSLSGEDEGVLRRYCEGLAAEDTIAMPLVKAGVTPWECAPTSSASAGWSISTPPNPRAVEPQRGSGLAGSAERAGEADQGGHVVRPFEGGRIGDIALADAAPELRHRLEARLGGPVHQITLDRGDMLWAVLQQR